MLRAYFQTVNTKKSANTANTVNTANTANTVEINPESRKYF